MNDSIINALFVYDGLFEDFALVNWQGRGFTFDIE